MAELEELRTDIATAVDQVKKSNPLVGSITNFVTVDFVANAQLASGGSAAMVYLPDEGESLACMSGAFYINVGTLMPSHLEAMCRTVDTLCATKTPWVLDPVGIGLGEIRDDILMHMKDAPPSIVRCNASEAIALARLWDLECEGIAYEVRGVDSTDAVEDAEAAASALAKHIEGAVAVSGPTDLITDGDAVVRIEGGSAFMEKVTGFGCALGGVTAVYAAVASPFVAAVCGSAAFTIAANRAGVFAEGPAGFKVAFLDELYNAMPSDISDLPLTLLEG